jgi:hypothetical protein
MMGNLNVLDQSPWRSTGGHCVIQEEMKCATAFCTIYGNLSLVTQKNIFIIIYVIKERNVIEYYRINKEVL